MLISALSACHMLCFLHFAADAGIVVQAYEDDPEALGEVTAGGRGPVSERHAAAKDHRARGHRSGRRRRVAWAAA